MDPQSVASTLPVDLERVFVHLHDEFAKLQVGRANPAMVEGILVEAYGSRQALKNCASVSTLDAQTLSIQPWDRGLLRDIARGITDSGIGLNPQDNGESITIRVPAITEERRRELAKFAKKLAEDAKVSIRTIRQDALKKVKQQQDAGMGEDIAKREETEIQKHVDAAVKKVDETTAHKEAEIMKV